MQEPKQTPKRNRWGIRGVYAAFGVCLLAIVAGAWTTFSGIHTTLKSSTNEVSTSGISITTANPVDSVLSSDTEAEAEPISFSPPLAHGITKAYSGDTLVYSETMRDWRVHSGTDYAGTIQESVAAVASGTVTSCTTDPMQGTTVVVTAGDFLISYVGLQEDSTVSVGATVEKGDPIGLLSTIPMEQSDAPHLHLEIQQNGQFLDPESLMQS